ncbi:tRNA-binding protein [Paenimyroides aquimaris]|uniref:tRNA-binding protein n=1 Tax=Paenimyroides marinum TaxID=1159016 RepID=A0A1H6KDL4_9FLAO|nr:tRNA-binding protein [Paenimyroides aquimaris]SEH69883.1 tRNA-binding protein [Paenimyroides aquimaris]
MKTEISWNDFEKLDLRVGTIVDAQIFEKAKNPAYKLWIDFGSEIGVRKTSAQITVLYGIDDLIGKQIVAVVNFLPKQIANFMSECLVLGVVGTNKEVTLLTPGKVVENGLAIG